MFLIYKPQQFNDVEKFIGLWNKWVQDEGIATGVYFVASLDGDEAKEKWLAKGFDAVTPAHLPRVA